MKKLSVQMYGRITTARTLPGSSNLERRPCRAIVKPGAFLALFASSLLCACTGSPFGNAPETELHAMPLVEHLSVHEAGRGQLVLSGGSTRVEQIPSPTAVEQAKTVAMVPRRAEGLSGDWQGVLSQESGTSDGSMVTLGRVLRVSLEQAGTTIMGSGEVNTGERLKISGTVEQGHAHGIVENITYGMTSRFVGTVTDAEIVVHFTRGGGEADVYGVATLARREK